MKRGLLATAIFLASAGGGELAAAEPQAFYVNYSARVPTAPLIAHGVSIVHPSAEVDLAAAHRAGATVLAYLSVGEIAADAPDRAEAMRRALPLVGRNAVWNSDLIDLTDPRWAEFLVDELATAAARRGFDGFFIDTLDSVDLVAPGDLARTTALRQGLVAVVRRLRAAFPAKRIVINRGFFAWPDLRDTVDGVLVESLFATHDFASRTYRAVAPTETAALLDLLRPIAAAGRTVYVLDYADPTAELAPAMAIARRIQAEGFHAFVSTPTLDGRALAPLRPVARRICAFYGNLSTVQEDQVKWPAESFTALKLQLPLEWLGYEVDYHKVAVRADLPQLADDCRAIVLPRLWQIPTAVEGPLVDWLIEQRQAGRRILILGSLPFRDRDQRARFLEAFGLGGSGTGTTRPDSLELVAKDAGAYDYESPLALDPVTYVELRAPADARRILALRARRAQGVVDFDPVFTCSWGGVALDPFLLFRRADFREFWRIDPFVFLQRALGDDAAPAPDTTTRNGRRLFLSHIDGDGFSNFSRVAPGQRSAEIVRDRILKKYPFPVTVSIIEAELRALIRTQRAEDAPALEAIARDIFTLPHVEAGAHSFSHPFVWIEGDRTEGLYDAAKLDLKTPYTKLDLVREIEGSVRYMNERLLPAGRSVQVFQWSGNCRPPPAALAMTRALGIENINGGDTVITARNRTLSAVAPRAMPWDGELQILAPNQNENVYTNNWRGPLFGTFSQVLETFALTETPRRLKPVNVYYHFYSGDYPASLHALETVYTWASTQPLHPVTVSHYARMARDARATAIFHAGAADRWIVVNQGVSRTLRLPAALATRLDPARSPGLLGWKIEGDQAYAHTDGSPVVTLTLAPGPATPQPRLESSSTDVAFQSRTPAKWEFTAAGTRPAELAVAGCRPGATVRFTAATGLQTTSADATGRAQFTLPPQIPVTVEFLPP